MRRCAGTRRRGPSCSCRGFPRPAGGRLQPLQCRAEPEPRQPSRGRPECRGRDGAEHSRAQPRRSCDPIDVGWRAGWRYSLLLHGAACPHSRPRSKPRHGTARRGRTAPGTSPSQPGPGQAPEAPSHSVYFRETGCGWRGGWRAGCGGGGRRYVPAPSRPPRWRAGGTTLGTTKRCG